MVEWGTTWTPRRAWNARNSTPRVEPRPSRNAWPTATGEVCVRARTSEGLGRREDEVSSSSENDSEYLLEIGDTDEPHFVHERSRVVLRRTLPRLRHSRDEWIHRCDSRTWLDVESPRYRRTRDAMGVKRCSHGKEKRNCAACTPCPHGKLKATALRAPPALTAS